DISRQAMVQLRGVRALGEVVAATTEEAVHVSGLAILERLVQTPAAADHALITGDLAGLLPFLTVHVATPNADVQRPVLALLHLLSSSELARERMAEGGALLALTSVVAT